ncbi:Phage tail assembly chaperone protein [Entomobacter blattae]|uniref:Phage tail assembly chaperone protein n=1 Tax=Entomobacter blattae TaxID=2762277 RepID=A0A7H1NUI4_9PROT|nr:Phage tail assembly chaperone protein [Entomobacter blattae]
MRFVAAFENDNRRNLEEEPSLDPSLTLVLDSPVKTNKTEFDTMHLREPTVMERKISGVKKRNKNLRSYYDAEVQLVKDVSEWPLAAVLAMPISQFVKASDYLQGFFMSGQKTGMRSPMM